MKYRKLVEELQSDIWPEGLPENISGPALKNITAGLVHIQRYVPCFQTKNISRYPQCSTYFQAGKTVVDAPKGRISKVYTIQAGDEDYPALFRQTTKADVDCHSLSYLKTVFPPENSGFEALPLGFKYPESTSDYKAVVSGAVSTQGVSKHYRAVTGRWALDKGKLWVSPWLNSNEVLVAEWEGLQQSYGDEDIVPDDADFIRALKLYVHKEYCRDFDNDYEKYRFLSLEFNDAVGDLIYECSKQNELKQYVNCQESFDILAARRNAKASEETVEAAAEATSLVFAQIGDYGASAGAGDYDGTNAGAVATLVKGWSPSFIVTTGDNSYDTDGSDSDAGENYYDVNIGQHYSDYIFPFGTSQSATYTSTAKENKFFPAVGNHDYQGDPATSLSNYLSYFTLPGNERFYDFKKGGIHFFCVNSGINTAGTAVEPEVLAGSQNTSPHRGDTSAQADWLASGLNDSDCHWKVVYFHHPPHSSDENASSNSGTPEMRWPFKDWGADIVLSGHAHSYERLKGSGDFPYIVNGAGGAPLRDWHSSSLASGITSVKKYNALHGALKGTMSDDTLKFEFISKDGTVQDTLTLTKAANAASATYS
jgi:hypothetical protein